MINVDPFLSLTRGCPLSIALHLIRLSMEDHKSTKSYIYIYIYTHSHTYTYICVCMFFLTEMPGSGGYAFVLCIPTIGHSCELFWRYFWALSSGWQIKIIIYSRLRWLFNISTSASYHSEEFTYQSFSLIMSHLIIQETYTVSYESSCTITKLLLVIRTDYYIYIYV